MSGQANRGRFYAWAGVAVLSVYCLFVAGAWQATYYSYIRVWALIPAFVGVAVWIGVAIRDPFWRPRTVLAPAFAAAFIAFAISTLTSRYPRFSVEYLALAVLLTALYLILQRLMASGFFRSRMMGLASLTGVLVGIAYIAVTIPHWLTLWRLAGSITAPPLRPGFESLTLGNPSAVMTVSVLLGATAVAYIGWSSRTRLVIVVALIALALMVTVISGSRSGWLALGFAVLIVGIFWVAGRDRRDALRRLARSRTARLAIIPLLLAAVVAAIVVGPGLLGRAGAGGEALRAAYWAASVRMFESSPLVGTGPGTWVPQRVPFTLEGEPDYYIPHAHSIYLQTLAEFGLVGVIAGLVLVVVLGRLLRGAIRDPDPIRRRMGWAALFATVYFAGHQVLDFYANSPSILMTFAIPIAWLDASAREDTLGWTPSLSMKMGPRIRRIAYGAGVIALIAAATFLAWSERGGSLMETGTARLDALHPEAALPSLTAAASMDSAMPPYHFALGLALANTGDLAGAEAQFMASALVDDLPQAWVNIAAIRTRLGDVAGARDAIGRAMRLGSQQSLIAVTVGTLELELGEPEMASSAFATALLLSPSLAGDTWWTADPARGAVWPVAYSLAFEQAGPSTRFALALESGDTVAVNEVIAGEGAGSVSRLIADAWSGDQTALSALEARARADPLRASNEVNWLRRIYSRLGDRDRSTDFALWSYALLALANSDAEEIRVAARPVALNVAGSATLFSGHYAYRRPLPDIQLVSWLPQLVYE